MKVKKPFIRSLLQQFANVVLLILCVLCLVQIQIMKLNPSQCRGVQPMLSKLSESHLTSLGGASSELSPPDSGSEAWFTFSITQEIRRVPNFDGRWFLFFFLLFWKKADEWVWKKRSGIGWKVCILHNAIS